jgi:hypothetical protein
MDPEIVTIIKELMDVLEKEEKDGDGASNRYSLSNHS